MLKLVKKTLILLLLIAINSIVYLCKSIYKIYNKNKVKIEKFAKSFHTVLKEEISK